MIFAFFHSIYYFLITILSWFSEDSINKIILNIWFRISDSSRILCCLSVSRILLGFSAVSRFLGFFSGSLLSLEFSDSSRLLWCLSVSRILLGFSAVSRFLGFFSDSSRILCCLSVSRILLGFSAVSRFLGFFSGSQNRKYSPSWSWGALPPQTPCQDSSRGAGAMGTPPKRVLPRFTKHPYHKLATATQPSPAKFQNMVPKKTSSVILFESLLWGTQTLNNFYRSLQICTKATFGATIKIAWNGNIFFGDKPWDTFSYKGEESVKRKHDGSRQSH